MTNLDSLTPEELNARAAELMGLKIIWRRYCQDMNAAMELVEWAQENHGLLLFIRINPNGSIELSMECNGVCDYADKDMNCNFESQVLTDESLPLAITKGFILAMESIKEEG